MKGDFRKRKTRLRGAITRWSKTTNKNSERSLNNMKKISKCCKMSCMKRKGRCKKS